VYALLRSGNHSCVLEMRLNGATKQQRQREHPQFGRGDALLAAVAVVPGEDERNGQADQKCDSCELLDLSRPIECATEVLEDLQQHPRCSRVGEAPLHDLASAPPGPGALGSTLCRRVGHSSAPMTSECSDVSAGARGKQVPT